MSIFIAGFVVLTLLVNAPICGPLMTILKLDKISEEQLTLRNHVRKPCRIWLWDECWWTLRLPFPFLPSLYTVLSLCTIIVPSFVPSLYHHFVPSERYTLPFLSFPSHVTEFKFKIQIQIKTLFRLFGRQRLEALQDRQDEDDMLKGVDWDLVSIHCDMDGPLDKQLPGRRLCR